MAALENSGVSSDDAERGLVMAKRRPTALAARSTAANPQWRRRWAGKSPHPLAVQGFDESTFRMPADAL